MAFVKFLHQIIEFLLTSTFYAVHKVTKIENLPVLRAGKHLRLGLSADGNLDQVLMKKRIQKEENTDEGQ